MATVYITNWKNILVKILEFCILLLSDITSGKVFSTIFLFKTTYKRHSWY